MLFRSLLFAKTACQNAAKGKYDRLGSLSAGVFVKQLSSMRKDNCVLENKNNYLILSKRTFIWSAVIAKEKTESIQVKEAQKVESKPKEEPVLKLVTSDTVTAAITDAVDKPVIDTRNENIVTEKKDFILDNIKEQSLAQSKASVAAEPLKILKDAVVGPKEEKEAKEEQDKAAPVKKRKRVDLSAQSVERNFITPVRAMADFLLKPSDLESLPKTKRRSPYECEPPITVYWRKDVEAKALEVWGSKERLQKEKIKRDIEKKRYQQNIFTVKRRLRDYRREMGKSTDSNIDVKAGLMSRSGKVVITAVAINGANFLFKFFAWVYTGSHSMFSECIHSLADTINQLILAYGIHKSVQIADSYHPYGYSNMKYVASLISGVGIFCVGTGLSFYHGITGLISPVGMQDFYWAYFILGGSLVSEGATWFVALNSIKKGARENKVSVKDYIFRGQDPSVNVVLLEDAAAVIGVLVAGTCMGISSMTNSPVPDAVGSLLVGCILGTVASFIIYTNVAALVGRSIPEEHLERINAELETDVMIRAIHDVKGIDMGNYLVRYKAELDFDGRELCRAYLDKQDLNALLEEVRKVKNIDELEAFMLKHGENIVDMMGGEIDRIEMKLRKKFPEIRHCDLEVL